MTEITNTGTVPVRVAGQYLQPGESFPVAEDVAARLMEVNPDIVVAAGAAKRPTAEPTKRKK